MLQIAQVSTGANNDVDFTREECPRTQYCVVCEAHSSRVDDDSLFLQFLSWISHEIMITNYAYLQVTVRYSFNVPLYIVNKVG